MVRIFRSYELPPPPERISKRGLYILLIVVIAVVVMAIFLLSGVLFAPSGEKVSLIINYEKGEKMTYSIKHTMYVMEQRLEGKAIMNLEVLDFDGEKYKIRCKYAGELRDPIEYIIIMDRTGRILSGLPEYFDPSLIEDFPSIPGLGGKFQKSEARIGEESQSKITLRFPGGKEMTGTLKLRFSELITRTFFNIGELRVFKIDFSVPEILGQYQDITATGSINGYAYYEYGTCLLVEYAFLMTLRVSQQGKTYYEDLGFQINLIEHTK